MYAGADRTAVELGLVLPALVLRFVTTSATTVACGGATAGFATVGNCTPTEVVGFKLALSAIVGFGTTVGDKVPRLKVKIHELVANSS